MPESGRADKYQVARAFHDHAEEYDRWFEESLAFEIETTALLSLEIPINSPALEVGVGPGRFAERLGIQFGMDPARAPLMLASGRGIRCCQALGEEMPLKNNCVNTIFLLFTLCFAKNPQELIMECARGLKTGGHLVIGMIPASGRWGKSLDTKRRDGHPLYRHARFYSVQDVKEWLRGVQMSIVEERATLYQDPDHVEKTEAPKNIIDEQAGFAIIVARKNNPG